MSLSIDKNPSIDSAAALDRRSFLHTAAVAVAAGITTMSHARETTAPLTAPGVDAAGQAGKSRWRKAVKYSMLPKNLEHEAKLVLAKECGFDGVEGEPIENLEEAGKLAELAKKVGVPFHGLVFGGWHAPLSDNDPAVRQKGIDGMKHALRCARAMGVDTVLLVPAVVKEDVPYTVAYERSQNGIRKIIPVAEEQKVYIGVENVWNKFLLSPMEFARYIDEIDNPWVKMYYDTANSLIQGFSQHWIRTLGKRIIKADVKDFRRKDFAFVDLGEGDVNWPEVNKALREIGYDDFLTAETGECTREQLQDISGRMDKVLSM